MMIPQKREISGIWSLAVRPTFGTELFGNEAEANFESVRDCRELSLDFVRFHQVDSSDRFFRHPGPHFADTLFGHRGSPLRRQTYLGHRNKSRHSTGRRIFLIANVDVLCL